MESLKHLLVQADDGYLEGLSNRGTVKRAYKDLEQEQPEVVWDEETGEAQAAFGDTVCHIRAPLGESTCSCPSRSVCRHIVAAILYLRQGTYGGGSGGGGPDFPSFSGRDLCGGGFRSKGPCGGLGPFRAQAGAFGRPLKPHKKCLRG